jgi:hypothetical protein
MPTVLGRLTLRGAVQRARRLYPVKGRARPKAAFQRTRSALESLGIEKPDEVAARLLNLHGYENWREAVREYAADIGLAKHTRKRKRRGG